MNRYSLVTRTMAIRIVKTLVHSVVMSTHRIIHFTPFTINWQKITRFGKLEISFNVQYIESIIDAGKL